MSTFKFNDQAKRVFLTAPFIVVADIETTGFSSNYDEIIEIGAVILDVGRGKLATDEQGRVRRFSAFIRPAGHKSIPAKISELTGITTAQVEAEGRPRNQVVEAFYQFIGSYPVAFHNAAFDWGRFLSRDMTAIGRKPINQIVCTMELAKYLYPERQRYNLEEMCQFLGGRGVAGHHRAWVDCTYTASLLLKMRDELIKRGEAVEEAQTEQSVIQAAQPKQLVIHRVQRWKKGQYDRIYFQTNVGSLFYDIKKSCWAYKDMRNGVAMGIGACVQEVLRQLDIPESELALKYPA